MKLTLNIPDELAPGVRAARSIHNAANAETEGFEPLATDAAYVEFVVISAATSWCAQHAPKRVETDNPKLVGENFTDADGRPALFVAPEETET